MYVIGKAEDAEGLAQGTLVKMKTIYEATKTLQEDLRKLEASFQDEGIEEVREVIAKIYQSIDSHFDDVVHLSNGLKEYAEILRRNA